MRCIGALHIKTSICTRIHILKDSLTIFTNYLSVTKDQALEETAFTLFYSVFYSGFQPIDFTIKKFLLTILEYT